MTSYRVCRLLVTCVHRGLPYLPIAPSASILLVGFPFSVPGTPPASFALGTTRNGCSVLLSQLGPILVELEHKPFGFVEDTPVPPTRILSFSDPQLGPNFKHQGGAFRALSVAQNCLRSSTIHICQGLSSLPRLGFSSLAVVPDTTRPNNRSYVAASWPRKDLPQFMDCLYDALANVPSRGPSNSRGCCGQYEVATGSQTLAR